MSLVVAAVEIPGIYAAAETKLTLTGDPERTGQMWTHPWRKLHILRQDLFVGITGSSIFEASEHLVQAARNGTAETVEWAAADLESCDVIIGSLDPLRLVRTRFGERLDMTGAGTTWAGDPEAYDRFQQLTSPAFGSSAELGLQAPMQSLAAVHRTETVGGYVTQLITVDGSFRYRATPIAILAGVEACVLVGGGETPGAMAIHVPQQRTGYVYCQDTPWRPIEVPAATCEDLVAFARDARGQSLELDVPCGQVSLRPPSDQRS